MCKAYRVSDFEEWKARFEAAVPTAKKILMQAGLHKWSRAHFPGERYNIMTSNSAESVNSLSVYARTLPIIMLIEFFRNSVQKWYFVRREVGAKLENEFTPWAEAKFAKRKLHSSGWSTNGISQSQYEVDDGGKKSLVNFGNGTCSCRKWQLSAIPCGHVISVARFLRLDDCNQFFAKWYSKNIYQQTYQDHINPLPEQSEWEYPSDLMIVRPPFMNKRQAGRPREIKRILSRGEEKKVVECSRCHKLGHMRNNCTAPVPSESTWRSKTRKFFGIKQSKTPQHVHHQFDLNEPNEEAYEDVNLSDF